MIYCILILFLLFLFWMLIRTQTRLSRMETSFSRIFELVPLRLCICDRDGKILLVYAEPEFKERIVSEKIRNVQNLPEIHAENAAKQIRFVFDTGKTVFTELAGGKRQAAFMLLREKPYCGNAVLWCSFDTESRRKLKTEVYSVTERNRAIMNAVEEALILTDEAGLILELNARASEFTGMFESEMLGKKCSDVLHLFHVKSGKPVVFPVLQILSGEIKNFSARITLDPSASSGIFLLTASLMKSREGQLTGMILLLRNITRECQYENDIEVSSKFFAYAGKMLHVSYFYGTSFDDKIHGGKNLELLWPFADNEPLKEEYWIHPDDLNGFLEERDRLKTGKQDSMDREFRTRYFGKMRYYHLYAQINEFSKREDGSRGILGILQDVTEIKLRELKNQDILLFIQTLMNVLPCPVMVKEISDEYRYLLCSRMFCDILKKKEDEIIGKTDFDIFPEEEAQHYRSDDIAANRANAPYHTVDNTVDSTGKIRSIQTIKVPYNTADGRRMLFVIGVDVSELEESRRQLAEAAKLSREAANAKSMFLATMSHELRTPLNVIIGFSELLQSTKESSDSNQEYVKAIYLAGTALLSLINDILDLSKLEAGQMKLNLQKMNLVQLLNELRSMFDEQLRSKQLFGILECPEELPCLFLDEPRLRQILLNLLGNSVKFTEHGGVTVRVEWFAENPTTGKLILSVIDTGIGMSEEYQKKIFNLFEQDINSRVNSSGTGLGLPICKRLAEQMGGRLTAISHIGEGSVFRVELDHVKYSQELQEDQTSEISEPHHFSGSVLVVDDVAMNRKILEIMLQRMGFDVVSAASASDALTLLEEKVPDLIFTDQWMPGGNGLELMKKIRAQKRFDAVKMILVTADSEKADGVMDENCSAVLLKPVTIHSLNECLGALNKEKK